VANYGSFLSNFKRKKSKKSGQCKKSVVKI